MAERSASNNQYLNDCGQAHGWKQTTCHLFVHFAESVLSVCHLSSKPGLSACLGLKHLWCNDLLAKDRSQRIVLAHLLFYIKSKQNGPPMARLPPFPSCRKSQQWSCSSLPQFPGRVPCRCCVRYHGLVAEQLKKQAEQFSVTWVPPPQSLSLELCLLLWQAAEVSLHGSSSGSHQLCKLALPLVRPVVSNAYWKLQNRYDLMPWL